MHGIIKDKKAEGYTLKVHHKTIRDKNLSWSARGLLVYLLSNAKNWKITLTRTAQDSCCGIHVARAALYELERYGYAISYRSPATRNLVEWSVAETPDAMAEWLSDKPDVLRDYLAYAPTRKGFEFDPSNPLINLVADKPPEVVMDDGEIVPF